MAWMNIRPRQGIQYVNEEPGGMVIEVAIGHFTLPRIDRVVIRHDFVANDTYLAVAEGVPNSTPQAPTLQRDNEAFELGIATVRVAAGAISVSQGNVSDTRLDETVCGVMRDAITQIPTQQLHDDWSAWFNELRTLADGEAEAFLAWLVDFKNTNEADMSQWIDSFKQANQEWWDIFVSTTETTTEQWIFDFKVALTAWFNDFSTDKEQEFSDWFALLQNTLDENQASNLFNLIDQHKTDTPLTEPNGVHGIRLFAGALEVMTPEGWLVIVGARIANWRFRDSLQRTWIEWGALGLTWNELDNMKEVHD
jgi:hypothetical protein